MPHHVSPTAAWTELRAGNNRFISGEMLHPSQGFDRREQIKVSQNPFALVFGCSDSRVAAEIIFDQGLGDVFVVRTAGHVLDTTVIGSIEYGVDILDTQLIVVLGHDNCGAIGAAVHALTTGEQPNGFIRAVTDRVIPSIVSLTSAEGGGFVSLDTDVLRREHVRHTMSMLHSYSAAIAKAVAEGRCAIVGVEYDLEDGSARLVDVIGNIGDVPLDV